MEFCSSEESLLEAQHGRDDSSPQETCKQSEVVDEGENLEPPLSPGLLAELSLTSFTPMRITRRMASMRESFTRSLGISVGEKISEEETGAPVVKKTGKRTAGRGAGRSGWTKNSIIVKESGEEGSVLARKRGSKGRQKANGKTLNEVKARGAGKKKGGRKKKLQEEFGDETDEGGEDVSSGVTEGEPAEKVQAPKMKLKSPGVGWVMCDECQKWRCISSDLADAIEASDVKWTCKENPNRKFADCSVPQEKTNAEINAELNISEISTSEGDDIDAAVSSKSRASWSQIQHNIFHHRQQKKLDDDDTLICHCRAPADGPGCGDDCLNRMMNVECSPDTCPCGERCSNQQFGKRMYARFELVRCGKKGFGLRASEHIPMGSFIIEYVGEVLDIRAFELRQKEYTREGQKHFYFMTLNSSEVIDACRKGNLGRFINHSCEPNCQTEKWCVNGEICIGLFALRDVKKNEEITFNYNFERLYGAAARRCHCGSRTCSGFIGEPPKPGDVVQSDSEEDLEPIILKEEESDEENVVNTETPQEMEICTPPEETKVEQPEPELEPELEPEQEPEPLREPEPELQVVVKPKLPVAEAKTCRVKRAKAGGRPKKVVFRSFKPISCRSSRTEVEDKLDRLLNPDGGLSKKKDTPKQYLKLLVISTASGDASSEGTSCSMRDLSLLLDAMLKTSSRTILNEVIQKNGLQLLHNLVKQSRKSFTKIPILRKLLKVLELLADRKILSTKEMTSTPPRNGMESFVKSIFELTRHEDMEVQQISRRFQKNWIPDMYDILANDRSSSGNQFVHKYWGPDRFSQKRELFRSKQDDRPLRSKSDEFEEKHQRPQYEEKHQRPQYEERPYNRYDHEERPQKSQFRHSSDHEEKLQRLRHSSEPSEDSRLHQRPSSSSFKRSSDHHEERLQRRDHHEERHHERSRKLEDHPEQEAKRRRKGSRWDELPSMMQVSSVSSLQVQVHSQENGGVRRDESATPTTAVVEQCDSEPPGYSSKANSGNCRRQLEHRAPPEAHHQRIYQPGSSEAHYQRVDHPGSSEAPYRRALEQKVDRPGSSEALYRRPLEPKIDHLGGSSEACYRSSGSAEAFYRGSGSSDASYRKDHPGSSSEASYRRPPEQKFDRPGSSEGSYRKIDHPGSFEASHRRDHPGSFEASHRRSAEQKIEPPGTSEASYRRPGSSEGSGSYRRSIEPPGTGEASYRRPGSSEGSYRRSLEPKIEPPGTSEASYWRPESSDASYRRSSLEQKIEPPGTSEVSYQRQKIVDHPGSYEASYRRPGSSEAASYRKCLEQKIEPPGTSDASYRRPGSSEACYRDQRAPAHQVHQAIDHSITGAYRRASENEHHQYSSGASGVVSYRRPAVESQSSHYQASPGGFSAAPPRHNQWHRQQPASYRPQPSCYTNQTGASLYQQQQQSYQYQQQQSYLEAAPVTSHYNSYDQSYQSGYYQQQQQQHKFAGHHQPAVAAVAVAVAPAAAPVCYPSSHLVSVVHHQQQAPVAAPPGGSQFPGHCYSSQPPPLHAPPQDEEPPVPGL